MDKVTRSILYKFMTQWHSNINTIIPGPVIMHHEKTADTQTGLIFYIHVNKIIMHLHFQNDYISQRKVKFCMSFYRPNDTITSPKQI